MNFSKNGLYKAIATIVYVCILILAIYLFANLLPYIIAFGVVMWLFFKIKGFTKGLTNNEENYGYTSTSTEETSKDEPHEKIIDVEYHEVDDEDN